jgi:hypothetical protein
MRNYVTKLLRETKKNRNYGTFWRTQIQEVKTGGLYCGKHLFYGCFASFIQLKLRVITLHLFPKMAITRNGILLETLLVEGKTGIYMWKISFVWLFRHFCSTENYAK